MKTLILFTILFMTQTVFGKVLMCKQKVLPVKTEYTVKSNKIIVKYTAEKALKDFTIKAVRGLDGLNVDSKSSVAIQDLAKGQSVSLTVSYTKPEGEAFLVTDISANTMSQVKVQSLAIPIGELSAEQIEDRKKNIKSLPTEKKINKPGVNALEQDTKYHTMQLPEE